MKLKIKFFLAILLSGFFTCYFTYSALNGQYGIYNKYMYLAEEVVLEKKLENLKERTLALERRVARLSDDFLDIDLLDEQARKVLGYARSNEIIILNK